MNIITALVTPFNLKEELDVNALDQVISFQRKNGISSYWVLGTTGEFNMLNEDEKLTVVKSVLERSKDKENVIVGVSSDSVSNAIRLTRKMIDLGVGSVFSLPPTYHITGLKGLMMYFESLRKTGNKVYFYYNPSSTRLNIPIDYIRKLIEEGLIDGMKVSTSDLEELSSFVSLKDQLKFELFSGSDVTVLQAIVDKVEGIVTAVGNFAPELLVEIAKKSEAGINSEVIDLANKIRMLAQVTSLPDYPTGVKIAMKYRGLYVGNCRSPLQEDSNAQASIYFTLKDLEL
ncbi:4-hydroxy-tetrahydrodipicolinate synthase [Sulfuracidifex tepidarius]|uniref:4-hydroxy-tetrahydrodipicolinate synthase n=1 Tax=Sulfuracidifex tepidarius TaxID=1294262 RepID=A0A510DYQ0_9CREN|nr:dihydrodipicolinate synthase family protein [Sulfuracidifex tepidarius]BBG25364.1 4-hydroxy-tetrahydrodipicolinate synthase [Sulfuracidifex tepidarius]